MPSEARSSLQATFEVEASVAEAPVFNANTTTSDSEPAALSYLLSLPDFFSSLSPNSGGIFAIPSSYDIDAIPQNITAPGMPPLAITTPPVSGSPPDSGRNSVDFDSNNSHQSVGISMPENRHRQDLPPGQIPLNSAGPHQSYADEEQLGTYMDDISTSMPLNHNFNGSSSDEAGSISTRHLLDNSSSQTSAPSNTTNNEPKASHSTSDNNEQAPSSAEKEDYLPILHIASQRGHEKIVRILIERHVDVDERDSCGRTALMLAAWQGHVSILCLLLAGEASLDAVDGLGRTALHWVTLCQHEASLRLLLEVEGVDEIINWCDVNGWSALHVAVERGFEVGLRLLLLHGGDLSLRARKCESWKREEPTA